jgi:hypothetical protein
MPLGMTPLANELRMIREAMSRGERGRASLQATALEPISRRPRT